MRHRPPEPGRNPFATPRSPRRGGSPRAEHLLVAAPFRRPYCEAAIRHLSQEAEMTASHSGDSRCADRDVGYQAEAPAGTWTPADDAAPIDSVVLGHSLRPFGHSTMLPAAAYTAPAVFEWEQRHALAGSWICIGRDDELLNAGQTQQALAIGTIPVVLTREKMTGEKGRPAAFRAFANTCRHRGHELLAAGGESTARSMVCPYHAWSYGLDGRLIGAPRMRSVSDFDPAAMSLVELPLRIWHGWVLVNASGTAAPLPEHLGALEDFVAPYRPAELRLSGLHAYTLSANWKVIVEIYHECYHCP